MKALISMIVLVVFMLIWMCFLVDVASPIGLVKDKTMGWVLVGLGLFSVAWYFQFCIDAMFERNKRTQEKRAQ